MVGNHKKNPSATTKYFDPRAIAGLESMRFSTKRRIEGTYSGRHVARRQGGAGQYIDSREYSPGDDLRRLDWPAMGRTGRAYVRLYQDETNLSCLLTMDTSGSMHFGGPNRFDESGSKIEWCKYFATALSHLIVLGRDQVGLAVANTNKSEYLTPSAAPRQLRILHDQIASLSANGFTQLGTSLDDTMLRTRRRGVMLLISDFLVDSFDEVLAGVRKFRGRGWEMIAVHIVHPDEEHLPKGIAFRFAGMEGEGNVDCRPVEIRKVYEKQFAQHCQRVREGLLGAGCDYRRFSTGDSYLSAVRQFLVPRRG